MDKAILKQYSDALKEIKECELRIQQSRDSLRKIEESGETVSDVVTTGRKGRRTLGVVQITGYPYATYGKEKILLQARIQRQSELKESLLELTNQVEEFINSISKSRIREILTFRYIDRLNWRSVAKKMGPGNTDDGCRKEVERHMKKL